MIYYKRFTLTGFFFFNKNSVIACITSLANKKLYMDL